MTRARVVDEVRRRVQQDTTGHRGHKHDRLYRVRRLLRAGAEHLTDDTRIKLEAALQAGDPNLEVTIAWHCYQQLRATYHHPEPRAGRRQAEQLLDRLHTCPIPEIARLGRTLRSWRAEFAPGETREPVRRHKIVKPVPHTRSNSCLLRRNQRA